jgi:Cu2+-exporting ATPase
MNGTLTLPRVVRAESTARLADGEAAVVDDPQLQQDYTTWETAADSRRLGRSQLRLAGLTCAGCAGAVERALRAEPGVIEANASYGTQRASVLWDPERTRLSDLLGAVRRAGYDAAGSSSPPSA